MRIKRRRTKNETVGLLRFLQNAVDNVVVKHATVVQLPAGAAADAVLHGAVAEPDGFAFDAVFRQRAGNDFQSRVGAAVFVGAAVYHQYLHFFSVCIFRPYFYLFRRTDFSIARYDKPFIMPPSTGGEQKMETTEKY